MVSNKRLFEKVLFITTLISFLTFKLIVVLENISTLLTVIPGVICIISLAIIMSFYVVEAKTRYLKTVLLLQFILPISIIFKIMHWPYASGLLLLNITISLLFTTVLLLNSIKVFKQNSRFAISALIVTTVSIIELLLVMSSISNYIIFPITKVITISTVFASSYKKEHNTYILLKYSFILSFIAVVGKISSTIFSF